MSYTQRRYSWKNITEGLNTEEERKKTEDRRQRCYFLVGGWKKPHGNKIKSVMAYIPTCPLKMINHNSQYNLYCLKPSGITSVLLNHSNDKKPSTEKLNGLKFKS